MVDQIRRLQPMEPPGPITTLADAVLYFQRTRDYLASMQAIIDRRILPQLRKVEEQGDTKVGSASNVGSQREVFKEQSGTDLVFRTIQASEGLTSTQNTDDIDIELDISNTTALSEVPAIADEFILYDATATAHRRIAFTHVGKFTSDPSVSAAGSDQAGATEIVTNFAYVDSATATTADGVRLPTWGAGARIIVENRSGVSIDIFPHSSGQINNGTTDDAVTKADGVATMFINRNGTDWRAWDL